MRSRALIVVAWAGTAPESDVPNKDTTRWHIESNGATMLASGSVGDPMTVADDVVIDGKIIAAILASGAA